jgi:hypothetical protein
MAARSYLVAVGLASAYILLIRAEDLIYCQSFEKRQEEWLLRLLSGIEDLITAITVAKDRLYTQSPEEFLRNGISQSDLRDAFSRPLRCSQPICILLSQADRLAERDQTDLYDKDPSVFVLKFAPTLFKAIHHTFDYYRFDFLSSFYGHDGSARPDYRRPHYGAISNFLWIDSLLKPRPRGVGTVQRIVEGNAPTRFAMNLRRRFDPVFRDLWIR